MASGQGFCNKIANKARADLRLLFSKNLLAKITIALHCRWTPQQKNGSLWFASAARLAGTAKEI
jgi:hypothetical protein